MKWSLALVAAMIMIALFGLFRMNAHPRLPVARGPVAPPPASAHSRPDVSPTAPAPLRAKQILREPPELLPDPSLRLAELRKRIRRLKEELSTRPPADPSEEKNLTRICPFGVMYNVQYWMSPILLLKGMGDLRSILERADADELFALGAVGAGGMVDLPLFDDAAVEFVRRFHADPRVPEVLLSLGNKTVERGNLEEGLDYLRRLVRDFPIDPLAPQAHLALGQILGSKWRMEEAEPHFQQAVTRLPLNQQIPAMEDFGDACWNNGRPDQARFWYQQILQRPPKELGGWEPHIREKLRRLDQPPEKTR